MSQGRGASLEDDLFLETGTTQIPRYVESMLEEEAISDEALRTKLMDQIERMYDENIIDEVDVAHLKENLEDIDSAPLLHKRHRPSDFL